MKNIKINNIEKTNMYININVYFVTFVTFVWAITCGVCLCNNALRNEEALIA